MHPQRKKAPPKKGGALPKTATPGLGAQASDYKTKTHSEAKNALLDESLGDATGLKTAGDLDNTARTQTIGANRLHAGDAIPHNADSLEVGHPAPTSLVMGVTYIIARFGAFSADCTFISHDYLSLFIIHADNPQNEQLMDPKSDRQ
jgi:hypothetical protein